MHAYFLSFFVVELSKVSKLTFFCLVGPWMHLSRVIPLMRIGPKSGKYFELTVFVSSRCDTCILQLLSNLSLVNWLIFIVSMGTNTVVRGS